ncbi:hypothetical protein LSAT2_033057 [Lamellibrachia satsuma]|nr:hypothetical protein LSAT2_033057 [Lamellibrachia satsuma]
MKGLEVEMERVRQLVVVLVGKEATETGGKTIGTKETERKALGAKEKRVQETGGKATEGKATGTKAPGAQDSQVMGGKVPNVAQNLSLSSRTLHTLTVKWDAPDVGGLTGYTVSLEGDGTSLTQTPDNHTTVTFTGLAAGKEYTVGVVTVNGDQKSDQVEDKFYTELFAYKGTVTIVNQDYRETLADNTTKDYKDMSAKVEFEVRLAYSGSAVSGHIVAVTDIVFSKGSVKVDYKLELDTVSSTDTLKEDLVKYVEDHSGMINELQINPSSITYDGKVTPTKVFPRWLLVALPIFGCLAVIAFVVLVCVLVSRRTKRSEDTTARRNDRRWFGVGNMLWHQDNSSHRQSSRHRGNRLNAE